MKVIAKNRFGDTTSSTLYRVLYDTQPRAGTLYRVLYDTQSRAGR